MRAPRQLGSLMALLLLTAGPADAKVLAQGKPSQRVSWQKVQKANRSVIDRCRSTEQAKLVSADQCEKARAHQP